MTQRITVSSTEGPYTTIVEVQDTATSTEDGVTFDVSETVELECGECKDFYIWGDRRLVISEKAED